MQIVTKATSITDTSSTLINHIIINDYSAVEHPRDFPLLTDHEIIGTSLTFEKITNAEEPVYRRNLSQDKILQLMGELTGAWCIYTSTDVNLVYSDYSEIISAAVKPIVQKKYPWITPVVREAQYVRDIGYQKLMTIGKFTKTYDMRQFLFCDLKKRTKYR